MNPESKEYKQFEYYYDNIIAFQILMGLQLTDKDELFLDWSNMNKKQRKYAITHSETHLIIARSASSTI